MVLNVLQEYHNNLIPKAVEYSAGLLDYFFRRDIEVNVEVDSGQYVIDVLNLSGQDFSGGSFFLLQEDPDDPDGTRTLVQEEPLSSLTDPLTDGDHVQFTYSAELTEPTQFILVYQGTIGADSSGNPFDPVDANIGIAVKTFTLDPSNPDDPCPDCPCKGSGPCFPCGCD